MFYTLIDVATRYDYTPRKWLDTIVASNGIIDLFRHYEPGAEQQRHANEWLYQHLPVSGSLRAWPFLSSFRRPYRLHHLPAWIQSPVVMSSLQLWLTPDVIESWYDPRASGPPNTHESLAAARLPSC